MAMEREILFRGWNEKYKKWIYGYYFVNRATAAWFLNLPDGITSNWSTKASSASRVRAVSAFIF